MRGPARRRVLWRRRRAGASPARPTGGAALEEAGSGSADAGSRPEAVAVATSAAEDQPESTVGVASSDAAEGDCGAARPFGSEPRAEGGSGFVADTLLAVRHGSHGGRARGGRDVGRRGEV